MTRSWVDRSEVGLCFFSDTTNFVICQCLCACLGYGGHVSYGRVDVDRFRFGDVKRLGRLGDFVCLGFRLFLVFVIVVFEPVRFRLDLGQRCAPLSLSRVMIE